MRARQGADCFLWVFFFFSFFLADNERKIRQALSKASCSDRNKISAREELKLLILEIKMTLTITNETFLGNHPISARNAIQQINEDTLKDSNELVGLSTWLTTFSHSHQTFMEVITSKA